MNLVPLERLIESGPILLDFDGPVCAVFGGYPALDVASELVSLLTSAGAALPPDIQTERDPLAVLRWTGESCPSNIVALVEDALCVAERAAIVSAQPTPYGHDLIIGANSRGIPLAIVSNNSPGAIEEYLSRNGLAGSVSPIIGRAYANPKRMKPSPEPVLDAARALNVSPADCTLIGDSLSDIDAARAAGARVIGYANRPWKVQAFAGADAVVTSMGDVTSALSPVSPVSPEGE